MKTIFGILISTLFLVIFVISGCGETGGKNTGSQTRLPDGSDGGGTDASFACVDLTRCTGDDCCKESSCFNKCPTNIKDECKKLPKDFVTGDLENGIEFLKSGKSDDLEKADYQHLCSALKKMDSDVWPSRVTGSARAKDYLKWFVEEDKGYAVSLFRALEKKGKNEKGEAIFSSFFKTIGPETGDTSLTLVKNIAKTGSIDKDGGKKFFELISDDKDKLSLMKDLFISDWSEDTNLQPKKTGGSSNFYVEAFILDFFCEAANPKERKKIAESELFDVRDLIETNNNGGLNKGSVSKKEDWPQEICTALNAMTTVYESKI